MPDVEDRSGYKDDDAEKNTVDEFDDEDVEVEIVQYVDEYDEGYFTPSWLILVLMVLAIIGLVVGISIGMYRGWENNQFKCPACPGGKISLPDKVAFVPGEPDRTCQTWENGGDVGRVTEEQCPIVQQFTQVQCGCGTDPPDFQCPVCVNGDISKPDAILKVPGQPDRTCKDYVAIGLAGFLADDLCPSVQTLGFGVCGCSTPTFVCPVCASGSINQPSGSVTLPGQDSQSCSALDTATKAGLISPSECGAVQAFAANPCGCNQATEPEECKSVCPSGRPQNLTAELDLPELSVPGFDTLTCLQANNYLAFGSPFVESCDDLQNATAEICDCGDSVGFEPTEPEFVCEICPRGEIKNPTASITFNGDDVSCAELLVLANTGLITSQQCPGVQLLAGPCECDLTEPNMDILDTLAEEFGTNIYVSGTPEYGASRFLLFEDPRFHATSNRRHRSLQNEPLPTQTASPEAQSGAMMSLSALTKEELVQRYVAIWIYFSTTSNLEESWDTDCAASLGDLENLCTFSDSVNASKWLSADIECEWAGITCSDSDEITEIDLSGLGLKGELGDEPISLPSLSVIDFSENELSGTIPAAYFSLNNSLTVLKLYNNSFSGMLPSIDNGASLIELDVSFNELDGGLKVSSAPALQILNATGNELSGTFSNLSEATGLKVLDLSGNKYGGKLSGAMALFELNKLEKLVLGENFLSGSIPSSIDSWSNLQVLDLSGNNLNGNLPTEIGNLTALVGLDLSSNGFGGPLPTEIGKLASLESLDLYDNFLTGDLPNELADTESYNSLNVGKNEFTGELPLDLCNTTTFEFFAADCDEVTCECCTHCCSEEAGCNPVLQI